MKYWEKYDSFTDEQNKLFDIHGESDCVRAQKKFWEVEITAEHFTTIKRMSVNNSA